MKFSKYILNNHNINPMCQLGVVSVLPLKDLYENTHSHTLSQSALKKLQSYQSKPQNHSQLVKMKTLEAE